MKFTRASYCQSRPYADKRISSTELKICFMRLEIKTVWSCLPHHSYQYLPINRQMKVRNIAWTTKKSLSIYQTDSNLNPLLKLFYYSNLLFKFYYETVIYMVFFFFFFMIWVNFVRPKFKNIVFNYILRDKCSSFLLIFWRSLHSTRSSASPPEKILLISALRAHNH